MSWTHALRQIVVNCYKFHGREDLLPAFNEDEDKPPTASLAACMEGAGTPPHEHEHELEHEHEHESHEHDQQQQAVLTTQQVCIDQMTLSDVEVLLASSYVNINILKLSNVFIM
ncbi:putative DNA-binding protein Ewg [Operophtera brumata]|uniref:Putative DNA-binding protein Ewg n=1 Tax=Operophtera brumata TaxID=104452 RepID=A0A0L7LJW9_OPEBR|nr:putative DNA-binding protein Ewg [Operophtera brumata]